MNLYLCICPVNYTLYAEDGYSATENGAEHGFIVAETASKARAWMYWEGSKEDSHLEYIEVRSCLVDKDTDLRPGYYGMQPFDIGEDPGLWEYTDDSHQVWLDKWYLEFAQ